MSINGRSIVAAGCIFFSGSVFSELSPLSEYELSNMVGRIDLPGIPILNGEGFDVEASGIEIDLDIQSSIDSVEWRDDDGFSQAGLTGDGGGLVLKGVHIGSSESPISESQVRSSTPFQASELAQIHGLLIQADPQAGTLITLERIGDTLGNGLDLVINDIYFGKDLSAQGQRGLGLLIEDISNFVSDVTLSEINTLFNLQLTTIDDGMNTFGGNYYPLKIRMQPIETRFVNTAIPDFSDAFSDVVPGIGSTSMILDAQFVIYMKKLAIYRENFEAGIEGLLIYNGLDTNGDGIEDTVGPVVVSQLRMETKPHQLADGSNVQAMHFSNIDINMDIAMSNIYIGSPETGSLGAVHINDLHISNTQLWIYPH